MQIKPHNLKVLIESLREDFEKNNFPKDYEERIKENSYRKTEKNLESPRMDCPSPRL